MILIDEHGDLVVKVTELEEGDGDTRAVVQVQEFRVSRRILIKASRVWGEMLGSTRWAEGSQDLIELKDDPTRSIEILFRVLHNAVDEATYGAPIKEIW